MIYYGIVDEIKPQHQSGIYGRRRLTKDEATKDRSSLQEGIILSVISGAFMIHPATRAFAAIPAGIGWGLRKIRPPSKIDFRHPYRGKENQLLIRNSLLNDTYQLKHDYELLYGLFDNFKNRENAFKTIMQSKGGSQLLIIERDDLPENIEHFGGSYGKFSTGLYCEHPKKKNMLIPLNNSTELIKTLVLEETIRAYAALGAKKIIIEDEIEVDSTVGGKQSKVAASAEVNYKKEVLRTQEFGPGTFDPDKAQKDNLFIHDYPAITTLICMSSNQSRPGTAKVKS